MKKSDENYYIKNFVPLEGELIADFNVPSIIFKKLDDGNYLILPSILVVLIKLLWNPYQLFNGWNPLYWAHGYFFFTPNIYEKPDFFRNVAYFLVWFFIWLLIFRILNIIIIEVLVNNIYKSHNCYSAKVNYHESCLIIKNFKETHRYEIPFSSFDKFFQVDKNSFSFTLTDESNSYILSTHNLQNNRTSAKKEDIEKLYKYLGVAIIPNKKYQNQTPDLVSFLNSKIIEKR